MEWASILLRGVRERRQPGGPAGRRAVAPASGGGPDRDAGAGGPRRPSGRRRPPRPEAGQCADDDGGSAQDHRLRPPRRPQLPGARTGRRQVEADRPGGGRPCAGGDPVPAADRPAAVPGRRAAGRRRSDGRRPASPAAAGASEGPARRRTHLSEMSAKRAGAAPTPRRRRWRRTWRASSTASGSRRRETGAGGGATGRRC